MSSASVTNLRSKLKKGLCAYVTNAQLIMVKTTFCDRKNGFLFLYRIKPKISDSIDVFGRRPGLHPESTEVLNQIKIYFKKRLKNAF